MAVTGNNNIQQISLNDVHSILLDMAKAFHQICYENNIPYYMLGGTMLGAIRHKGFIPWDDDMDIGIPREYFPVFLDVCRKNLPSYYKVLYYDNSDYAVLGFSKLSDSRTVVEEIIAPITSELLGVNIDVFPLDNADEKTGLFSFNMYVRLAYKVQRLLFYCAENRPFLKQMLAKISQMLFHINRTRILRKLDKQLSAKADKNHLPMYANYFGAWGLKELVPKAVFGTPTLYDFEDTRLYGVQYHDAYLKQLYGDYMQMPPVEEQHLHSSNYYKIE